MARLEIESRHSDYGEDAGGYRVLRFDGEWVGRVTDYEAGEKLVKFVESLVLAESAAVEREIRDGNRIAALEAFFRAVANLTMDHDAIEDFAVVFPDKLDAALKTVDPEWYSNVSLEEELEFTKRKAEGSGGSYIAAAQRCTALEAENKQIAEMCRDIQQNNADLRKDNEEYQRTFDLQRTRMDNAIAYWHEQNPGNEHVLMPDLGKLLDWLVDRYVTGAYPLQTLSHAIDHLLNGRPLLEAGDIDAVALLLEIQREEGWRTLTERVIALKEARR